MDYHLVRIKYGIQKKYGYTVHIELKIDNKDNALSILLLVK